MRTRSCPNSETTLTPETRQYGYTDDDELGIALETVLLSPCPALESVLLFLLAVPGTFVPNPSCTLPGKSAFVHGRCWTFFQETSATVRLKFQVSCALQDAQPCLHGLHLLGDEVLVSFAGEPGVCIHACMHVYA